MIFIGIIAVCIIIYLGIHNLDNARKNAMKRRTQMSFKESLDLTDLPVVTFYQGDKKFNFLLDTGATESVINKSALSRIKYTETTCKSNLSGIDGINREAPYVEIEIAYKDNMYTERFLATDMSEAFGAIKKNTGVTLHGIIGNAFMQKYKYIIDFKELIAYR